MILFAVQEEQRRREEDQKRLEEEKKRLEDHKRAEEERIRMEELRYVSNYDFHCSDWNLSYWLSSLKTPVPSENRDFYLSQNPPRSFPVSSHCDLVAR